MTRSNGEEKVQFTLSTCFTRVILCLKAKIKDDFFNVIFKDVPRVSFENIENKEDGTQRYVVTIQSVPSPLFVQWSSKGKNKDVYTPIDCNEEDYKGTLNTIPHPVLVVKKSHLENYNYQIEVTNFVGCTVKQISGLVL